MIFYKTILLNRTIFMLCLFVTLAFSFQSLCASTPSNIDSLRNELKLAKEDTAKVKTYIRLSRELFETDIQQSMQYAFDGLALARKIANNNSIILCLDAIAANYQQAGNYRKAIEYFEQEIEILAQLNKKQIVSEILNSIGSSYFYMSDYDNALTAFQKSLKIDEDLDDKPGISTAYVNIGNIYKSLGNPDKALDYYRKSLEIDSALNDSQGVAISLNNIGNIYKDKLEYNLALEYYEKSLSLKEKTGKKKGIAVSLNNIGAVYDMLKQPQKAQGYYERSLKIKQELGDAKGVALTLNNIGVLYKQAGDFNKALEYYRKSLEISDRMNYKEAVILNYKAYSDAYTDMRNIQKAFEYFKLYTTEKDSVFNEQNQQHIYDLQTNFEMEKKEKEIQLQKAELANKELEVKSQKTQKYVVIGGLLFFVIMSVIAFSAYRQKRKALQLLAEQKQLTEDKNRKLEYANAEIYQQKEEIQTQADLLEQVNKELEKLSIAASKTDNAIVIFSSEGKPEWVNEGFVRLNGYNLEDFIAAKGDNLFEMSSVVNLKDSIKECIKNKKTLSYAAQISTKFNTKIWIQTTLTPIVDEDGKIVKLVAIDTDISKLKEAEIEVQQQKEKLQLQSDLLTAINKDLEKKNILITDSIRYAKLIQDAILPPEKLMRQYIAEFFIFYRPRDIVSGDIYWFHTAENKLFLASVDCSGHGVSGAFMSMIANALLNEIIKEKRYNNLSKILEKLNTRLIFTLSHGDQGGNTSEGGMDISLCCIDSKNNELQVAAANQTVFLFRNNQLTTIDGDIYSIGSVLSKNKNIKFKTTVHKLEPGSMLYLLSDGYQDQAGGETGKKFMITKLEKVLMEIQHLEMQAQQQIIAATFDNWKGNNRQTDDVLVWGIKI